jgi:hypothetical protein
MKRHRLIMIPIGLIATLATYAADNGLTFKSPDDVLKNYRIEHGLTLVPLPDAKLQAGTHQRCPMVVLTVDNLGSHKHLVEGECIFVLQMPPAHPKGEFLVGPQPCATTPPGRPHWQWTPPSFAKLISGTSNLYHLTPVGVQGPDHLSKTAHDYLMTVVKPDACGMPKEVWLNSLTVHPDTPAGTSGDHPGGAHAKY